MKDGLRIAVLVIAVVGVERWLFSMSRLSPEGYQESVLPLAMAAELGLRDVVLLIGCLVCLLLFRRLWEGWTVVEDGAGLRLVTGVAVVLLAWDFSTYPYNLYLDQTHATSRLLLIVLAGLVLWRPIFLFPFLLILLPLIRQFEFPLGGFLWSVEMLPIRIALVSCVAWVVSGLTGRRSTSEWLLLMCCVTAVCFWYPGYLKLQLEWWSHEQVAYALSGAYTQGWLSFLSPSRISDAVRWLLALNPLLVVGTLALEWGALFFLWKRRLFRTALLFWMCFHVGALLLYGFFFWKWMLLEVALFVTLQEGGRQIFAPRYFAVAMVLIATGPLWLPRLPALAWYDTPLSYAYRFEVLTTEGERFDWLPRHFAPYDDTLAMGNLDFLARSPRITGPYGVTTRSEVKAATRAHRSAETVPELERSLARAGLLRESFDRERAQVFDGFVRRLIRHRNRDGGHDRWWHGLAAPPLLLSIPRGEVYADQAPVARLIVTRSSYFHGPEEGYRHVRDEEIRTVDVAAVPGASELRRRD